MKVMSKDLYQEIWLYIDKMGRRAKAEVQTQADNMANWADSPQDIAFTSAVKAYKRAKEEANYLQELIDKLEELEEGDDN